MLRVPRLFTQARAIVNMFKMYKLMYPVLQGHLLFISWCSCGASGFKRAAVFDRLMHLFALNLFLRIALPPGTPLVA